MRIVAGQNRGQRLSAPPGDGTRPTSDRIRESLFNILESRFRGDGTPGFAGLRVLDAFAGTGALGLEALSRGAERAFFMERDKAAQQACRANIRALGVADRAELIPGDCLKPPPAPAPCQLVFLDPPYGQDLAPPTLRALTAQGWLTEDALIVLETSAHEPCPALNGFSPLHNRRYGKTAIHIWQSNSRT